MKILALLAAILLSSCALPQDRPELVDGRWTAWTISVDGVELAAPSGARGINVKVLLYEKDGHWYMWPSGEELIPL